MDGSFLPASKYTLSYLKNMPFVMQAGAQKFIFNQVDSSNVSREIENEAGFNAYCKSIGIPNKDSDVLSSFLHRMYESLPDQTGTGNPISNQNIKSNIFNSLSSFGKFPDNQWGTSRISSLKNILAKKEKELITLNTQKLALDKKAYSRANLMLYLGGTTLIGQFAFIVSGTYLFYCWDVMEPMAYLMLTSNLTAGFTYYWWNHDELEFEPLQGRFKSRIANKIYKRSGFDYIGFKELESEVKALRELINRCA